MTRKIQSIWMLPIILGCISFCLAESYIDYDWQSEEQKSSVLQANRYNSESIFAQQILPLENGKVFVTTPKDSGDNPASLSTMSDKTGDGGPLLTPYPDWSWHKPSDCAGIISVNKVVLDACNRLWFVDSGKINGERICSAKIMSFDVNTNEQLSSYQINEASLTDNADGKIKGVLVIDKVETSADNCFKVKVYITDPDTGGQIIWDRLNIWSEN